MEEVITAVGHQAVTATHGSTLEVTTDSYLTAAGDCIIAIDADRAPAAFDRAFVECCQDGRAAITATIEVDGITTEIVGTGHADLTCQSDRGAIIRTSRYVDDRTVIVAADQAASDLDRAMVDALANGASLELTLTVTP